MSKKQSITLNEGMWNYYHFIILFLVRAGIQYIQAHNNQYVASIIYHYYSLIQLQSSSSIKYNYY